MSLYESLDPTLNPRSRSSNLHLENRIEHPWIDLAKGIFSILIVLQHIQWINSHTESWIARHQLVVNCFFVISGFLMLKSINTKYKSYHWFISRRISKIFPTYHFCLVFSILALSPPIDSQFWTTLCIQLAGIQGLIPEHFIPDIGTGFLEPAWFVSCILQLYLLAPWLASLSETNLWRCFAFSLIVLLKPINWRLYVWWSPYGAFFPQKLYLFILGMLLYQYIPMLGSSPIPKSFRIATTLGIVSYPLYLVHFPILQLLPNSLPILIIIGIPLSIIAALILYRTIE